MRSWRSAATKVIVFQWPCGTLVLSLLPRGAQPLSGAMLVLSLSKDGPGLIDEHQALGRDPGLLFFPLLTPSGDLRAILLAGEHGFFLKLSFSAWTKFHTVR
jgi:hypothetical protein